MRALTVQQPWAHGIVHCDKTPENRTRNIAGSYRGPVAIHAGLQVSQDGVDHELLRPLWAVGRGYVHTITGAAQLSYKTDGNRETPARAAAVLPLGVVIGVVDLVGVHHDSDHGRGYPCSPWAIADNWHLVLENARPLEQPIPARGRLGLWTPDAELLGRIREQVPA